MFEFNKYKYYIKSLWFLCLQESKCYKEKKNEKERKIEKKKDYD